jgi:hypothetical protein
VDVVPAPKSIGEDVMGYVAACILVGLMLPLLGMLYLDVLEAKHEAKAQLEKVEKLRRKVERELKDGQPTEPAQKRSP